MEDTVSAVPAAVGSDDDDGPGRGFTAAARSLFGQPAIEAARPGAELPGAELPGGDVLRSVYEVARDARMSVEEWVQADPSLAVRTAEASCAGWQNVLTMAAMTGGISGADGEFAVSKNQTKLLEVRVREAERQLDYVRECALSASQDGDRKRDALLKAMYRRALRGNDRLGIYLVDRQEGRPAETRQAELDMDNARNVYYIIRTLFDRQLEVLNSGSGKKLICCSRRAGKCWAPDTLLRRFDGSVVRAEDVEVGDVMMGADGKGQKVLSTCSGEDMMYRIVANKRGSRIGFVCNSVHVLTVKFTGSLAKTRSAYKDRFIKGNVYDIPLNEFLALPKHVREKCMLWRQRTEYPETRHVIDPYILGLWLGDGDKERPALSVGVGENEVLDAVSAWCAERGYALRTVLDEHSVGRCNRLFINAGKVLRDEFRRLRLFRNKHVPEEYLVDSVRNRLELLAGLIDSDGYYSPKKGTLVFENTDRHIVDGVLELCDSLGFHATFNERSKKFWSEARGEWSRVVVYSVFIKGETSIIPCRVPRKRSQDSRQSILYGFRVERVGMGRYSGFTLDGDGRLLLSDYTVTHNTHLLVSVLLIECLRKPRTKVMYIGETMSLSEQLVNKAVNDIVDACDLRDSRGRRFNWRKMDNGSEIMVRGLSNTKDPDLIRGNAAKVIVIDEFFHLKSELLEYMQREVLEPMQLDYADDYMFICAGTPPQVKGTYGEHVWNTLDAQRFTWTWRDNPHPVDIEKRREYVDSILAEKGLDWTSSFARREYNGEWVYDEDLLLYPDFHTYDPRGQVPQLNVTRVLFGIDYGVGDNDTLWGCAWDDDEHRGYQFWEDKFNRLDLIDRNVSQLDYLCGQVALAWEAALAFFPHLHPREANKRILWDADDNDQHVSDHMAVHVRRRYVDPDDGQERELVMNIRNAHKTDRAIMFDKIGDLLRRGDLLIMRGGKTERELESTILMRGPNGEVYREVDSAAYHPDLLPAMRYALWNVVGATI